ncbi:hypothetical protein ES703_36290 [subsurface metagenome]
MGDAGFRAKCERMMDGIRRGGSTIVFVSHDMNAVMHICDRVLWLENGQVVEAGNARDVVLSYLDNTEKASMLMMKEPSLEPTLVSQPIKIDKVALMDKEGKETYEFEYTDDLEVQIHYSADENIGRAYFAVWVSTVSGECLFRADMRSDKEAPMKIKDKGVVKCKFNSVPLLPNIYMVGTAVISEDGVLLITATQPKKFRIKRIKYGEKIPEGVSVVSTPITFVPFEWER